MVNRLRHIDPSRRQLRWALLLLSGAVILPTVCLVWFMGQAVHNVRSAARQRQVEICRRRVKDLKQQNNRMWLALMDWRVEADALSPAGLFRAVLEGRSRPAPYQSLPTHYAAGALIYDARGALVFPAMALGEPQVAVNESQMFRIAWRCEHILFDYDQAAREYLNAFRSSDESAIRLRARLGAIRCRYKADQRAAAVSLSKQLLAEPLVIDSAELAQQITHLRIQLVEQLQDQPETQRDYLRALLYRLTSYSQEQAFLAPTTRSYFMKKALALAERYGEDSHQALINRAERLLQTEMLCTRLGELYPHKSTLGLWPDFHLRCLDHDEGLYGFQIKAAEKTLVVLLDRTTLVACLQIWLQQVLPSGIPFQLQEDGQTRVSLVGETEVPLLTAAFCDYLPGWTLDVMYPLDGILDQMAQRQTTTYIWTGSLVILLLFLLGLILTGSLRRQVQLHRLKNDFIATVTHELKTPLASMRLLVDTLLEGRYRDQEQVTEYLQLVAKENKRLTGLIDNFLTFSRMERNKQAFTFQARDACEIALDAAQAVRAKMTTPGTRFSLDVPDTLPRINADHDAMVTVLMNLLDNAFKYSGEDKHIELRAQEFDGRVCYKVRDNGWGIPRGAQRRIFSKFYQVDRSLTRRREGCGLGLSIIKFIVDAHPGATIAVDSRVGKGSTFTVCLPALAARKETYGHDSDR